jgi:hypothetical protein
MEKGIVGERSIMALQLSGKEIEIEKLGAETGRKGGGKTVAER